MACGVRFNDDHWSVNNLLLTQARADLCQKLRQLRSKLEAAQFLRQQLQSGQQLESESSGESDGDSWQPQREIVREIIGTQVGKPQLKSSRERCDVYWYSV